ncbi:MAG: S9 family peptidase [Bacteroidales bacterium]
MHAAESPELKDIVAGKYRPASVPHYRSLADGEYYVAPADGNTMIVKYAYKTGLPVDTLFNSATARECPFKRFDGYELSSDESKILLYTDKEMVYRHSYKAKYYTFEIKRDLVKPLSDGFQQAALFSPNGRMVAFVRDNNIFLKKLDYGTESQVTTDGKKNYLINGIPDWVYEEEFAMDRAMSWAPDNSSIAYIKFDESDVKEYPMQLFRGKSPELKENALYPGEFSYKYPVAGEKNAKVGVYTFNVENKVTKKMNVQVDDEDYIPRVRFTTDADKLAVMTLNRHQNLFKLHFANPASGVSKVALQDQNDAYVNADNMDQIRFYPEFFTFMSEKSGYRHLYQYGMSGAMMRQLTSGNWDVTDFYGYDPKTKSFYLQAAKESPMQREVYKVDTKGQLLPVAADRGTNAAVFSENFRYFQHYFDNSQNPLRVMMKDEKGKTLRVLEDNKILADRLKTVSGLAQKEFFQFALPSGEKLNGYILKPADFNPKKKYPLVMVQYSGPGSQQVLDRWKMDWTQYLTSEGFVVACVDGRGTGARGAAFERQTYRQLGVKESEDQIAAAHYLGSLPFVDPARIAIWGWSFGGYNTLMSMTGSDAFKVGIAVAPVTDWRFYDSVYTERYMRTPKENHDGYQLSSALERAKDLKGKLLIITGSADDNVHPQNTYEFTEALVQADIPFDMHVYTNRNHFINGGNTSLHLYRKMVDYLKNNL